MLVLIKSAIYIRNMLHVNSIKIKVIETSIARKIINQDVFMDFRKSKINYDIFPKNII